MAHAPLAHAPVSLGDSQEGNTDDEASGWVPEWIPLAPSPAYQRAAAAASLQHHSSHSNLHSAPSSQTGGGGPGSPGVGFPRPRAIIPSASQHHSPASPLSLKPSPEQHANGGRKLPPSAATSPPKQQTNTANPITRARGDTAGGGTGYGSTGWGGETHASNGASPNARSPPKSNYEGKGEGKGETAPSNHRSNSGGKNSGKNSRVPSGGGGVGGGSSSKNASKSPPSQTKRQPKKDKEGQGSSTTASSSTKEGEGSEDEFLAQYNAADKEWCVNMQKAVEMGFRDATPLAGERTFRRRAAWRMLGLVFVHLLFTLNRFLWDQINATFMRTGVGMVTIQDLVDALTPLFVVWAWWEVYVSKGELQPKLLPTKAQTLGFLLFAIIFATGHGMRHVGLALARSLEAARDTDPSLHTLGHVYSQDVAYATSDFAVLGMACCYIWRAYYLNKVDSSPALWVGCRPPRTDLCHVLLVLLAGGIYGTTWLAQAIWLEKLQNDTNGTKGPLLLLVLPCAFVALVVCFGATCRQKKGTRPSFAVQPLPLFVGTHSLVTLCGALVWAVVRGTRVGWGWQQLWP